MKISLFVFVAALMPFMCLADRTERFNSYEAKWFLAQAKQRGHQLTFVPDEPGKETGMWRITWDGGKNIAELLIPNGFKLPDFRQKIRIEMDIECAKGTNLLSADLRLLDSTGEVCALNSRRGNRYTGKITAVWEFTKDQNFKMAWGKNVNHKLDLPAAITNWAFLIQGNKGEITLKELRIFTDPQPAK